MATTTKTTTPRPDAGQALDRPACRLMMGDPHLRDAAAEPPGVVCDWLADQGCGLPDVLRLFAGTPPGHADGLPAAAVDEWLRREGRPADAARFARDAAPAGGPAVGLPFRWLGWVPDGEECRPAAQSTLAAPCCGPAPVTRFLLSGTERGAGLAWLGHCRDCGEWSWVCQRGPADARRAARAALARFAGLWCPQTWRTHLPPRLDVVSRQIDPLGPVAASNLRTCRTLTLAGGPSVKDDDGDRLLTHYSAATGLYHFSRWVDAAALVPPEPGPANCGVWAEVEPGTPPAAVGDALVAGGGGRLRLARDGDLVEAVAVAVPAGNPAGAGPARVRAVLFLF